MKCDVLMKITAKVQPLPSTVEILACFETLCGARPTKSQLEKSFQVFAVKMKHTIMLMLIVIGHRPKFGASSGATVLI